MKTTRTYNLFLTEEECALMICVIKHYLESPPTSPEEKPTQEELEIIKKIKFKPITHTSE